MIYLFNKSQQNIDKSQQNIDKQSEAQKEYQNKVESVGGLYYIAKDLDSFVSWFEQIK